MKETLIKMSRKFRKNNLGDVAIILVPHKRKMFNLKTNLQLQIRTQ